MRRWWITYSEDAQRELDELDESGWHYKIDQAAYDNGRLVINLDFPHKGDTIPLVAYYPPSYPYFMPTVSAPTLDYEHHQNPVNKHLCLLEQEGKDWRPGHDTLVQLLQRMFPELEQSNSSDASVRESAKQEVVAEPLSAFLPKYFPGAITHPSYTPPDAATAGTFVVATQFEGLSMRSNVPLQGTVTKIRDMQGDILYTSPLTDLLSNRLGYKHTRTGFWFQLPARPPNSVVGNVWEYVLRSMPRELCSRLPMKKGAVFIVAAVYRDEVTLGRIEAEWIFFVAEMVFHDQAGNLQVKACPIAGDIDTKESLLTRTPELAPLRGKRVLLVGLGSLGSPLALELARAGVDTLEMVDPDTLSIGNSVRWALGWSANGMVKCYALAQEIVRQHPYTTPIPHLLRVGDTFAEGIPGDETDVELLDRAVRQADLVIDATAQDRVGHYLADLCRHYERPFLWFSTTHGGWGGRIARVIPNSGQGCFHCLTHHLHDHKELIPPADPNGDLQARGCADITFTGAGVDASTIALQAARLAIGTLCRGNDRGYPDFDWNLAVIRLRDKDSGRALFPEVATYPLLPHANCSCQQP